MKKTILIMFLFTNLIYTQEQFVIAIDEWPPFRIIENEKILGLDIDVWNEIANRVGIKIKFERYPWARALKKMEDGEVDAMGGLAKTTERANFIQYTNQPYFTCTTVFYLQKGKGTTLSKYSDLYNFNNIGFVFGSFYFDPFNSDTKLKKEGVATEDQLLKLLESKRLDLIIGTECQVDYELKKLGWNNKFDKGVYRPGNNVDLYIGVSKKSKLSNKINDINKAITDMLKEGKIKEFLPRYY